MYCMNNPFKNVDWDFLIVLDACRYDFFSHYYKDYFSGSLSKIVSPGACTREWFIKSFNEYFEDVIYISANPYINSVNTNTGINIKTRHYRIAAKNHFSKIIDVWSFGWNDKLGTVHPQTLTQIALSLRKQYPKKRFIIHYLQPHAPYISNKFMSQGFPKPNLSKGQILTDFGLNRTYFESILQAMIFLVNRINLILGLGCWNAYKLYTTKISEIFNLPPAGPMEATRRMYGVNGLRKAYAENLKIALSHIAFLSSQLVGNIIITSDHGEFLGETGRFGHPCGCNHPIVRTVPWFKIDTVKKLLTPRDILRYRISGLRQKGMFH